MRKTLAWAVALAAACAGERPPPPPAGPPACDVLPLLGTAEGGPVAADASGFVAAGTFIGALGAGAHSVASRGKADVFVARFAPDDAVRWLRAVGGAGDERAGGLLLLPDGDVLVSGTSDGRCFVARLAGETGAQKWLSGLPVQSACPALAIDAQGQVWTAGSFAGRIGARASLGMTDAFVARVSATGDLSLLRAFGGKGRDEARAIAAVNGALVVAGQFGGEVNVEDSAVDFGRGPSRSAGDFDAFVVALGADGRTQWITTFGDTGDDDVTALAAAGDALYAAGHVQPGGNYRGLVPREVGNFVAYVARLDPGRGNVSWLRRFEGPGSDAAALAWDGAHATAAGWFRGALAHLTAQRADAFVATFDPAGTLLGARGFGSGENDGAHGVANAGGATAVTVTIDAEAQLCGKPIGSAGERTTAVVWMR